MTQWEMRVMTFVVWQERQVPPLAIAGVPAAVGMTKFFGESRFSSAALRAGFPLALAGLSSSEKAQNDESRGGSDA
jgi:hypothetical protein